MNEVVAFCGRTRRPLRAWARLALLGLGACASAPHAPGSLDSPRVMLGYGNGQAESVLSFPDSAYEALVRFDLPAGAGRPRRLWFRPAAAGTFQVSVYRSSPLDGPGEPLHQGPQEVGTRFGWEVGRQRWLVADLEGVTGLAGLDTVWVGFKKLAGEPALWSSDKDAGHYYMRSLDPSRHIALLPVRRAPLVQLELPDAP